MGVIEAIIETKKCTKCDYELSTLNFMGSCMWEADSNDSVYSYTHCANRAKARDHLKQLEARLEALERK